MRPLLAAIWTLLCACGPTYAANTNAQSTPRLKLVSARIEPAPAAAGRYALSGRFAAKESPSEPREGRHFVLTGRFAKGGASCDAGALFANGFETP